MALRGKMCEFNFAKFEPLHETKDLAGGKMLKYVNESGGVPSLRHEHRDLSRLSRFSRIFSQQTKRKGTPEHPRSTSNRSNPKAESGGWPIQAVFWLEWGTFRINHNSRFVMN